jgi:peptidyl-prolyl cis-trans isomerase C
MNLMIPTLRRAVLGGWLALAVGAAGAQSPTPPRAAAAATGSPVSAVSAPAADVVLVESPSVALRRSDYELELMRLPPDARASFPASQKRIDDVISRLWNQKALAAQARSGNIDADPELGPRIAAEIERIYAQAQIQRIDAKAAAEFEAKRATYDARAREIYLTERKRFELPAQAKASHILFDSRKHSGDEAKALATAARARIAAGADFNAVARELSEDPSAGQNAGRLDWFVATEMDPAFAAAAFALAKDGDVSEPVQSRFGWHLIRLDGKRPAGQRSFDEVKDAIIDELRQKYVNAQRDAAVAALRGPDVKVNQPAIEALYTPPSAESAAAARRAFEERQKSAPPVPAAPK